MRPGPPAEQIPNPEPRYCEAPCPQSCAPACYDWCCYPAILPPTQPVKIVMVKKPLNAGTPPPPQQPPPQNAPCMFSPCLSKKDIVANASSYQVKLNHDSNQSSSLSPSSPSNATDLTSSRSNATSLNGTAMIDGYANAPLNSSKENFENITSNAIAGNNEQPITLRSVDSVNETNSNNSVPETSNFANSTSNDGKIDSSNKQATDSNPPAAKSLSASPLASKDTYKKTTTEHNPNKSHKRSHLKHKNHKGFIHTEI